MSTLRQFYSCHGPLMYLNLKNRFTYFNILLTSSFINCLLVSLKRKLIHNLNTSFKYIFGGLRNLKAQWSNFDQNHSSYFYFPMVQILMQFDQKKNLMQYSCGAIVCPNENTMKLLYIWTIFTILSKKVDS